MAHMGCKKIIIINRTRQRSSQLAEILQQHYNLETEIHMPDDFDQTRGNILINATALDTEGLAAPPPYILQTYDTIFDMNYFPRSNTLIDTAKTHGIYTFDGLDMLLFQAVAAYEIFNDITVPKNIVDDTLKLLSEVANDI
jgi:shikimate dehydrogenase